MGPAPFLMKMYGMVDDDRTDGVISWAEKGTSFVVWEPLQFSRDLLPAHFKHNNFSSFVRQLNTYGFRKLAAERWEFANDNFRRGEEALLSCIRRRKAPSATENAVQNDQRWLKKRLTNENRNLRRENETLGTELAQAKQHCKRLLVSLSRHIEVSQLDDLMPLLASQGEGGEALNEEQGEGNCNLKLFGVLLKCNNAKRIVEADNDRRVLGS